MKNVAVITPYYKEPIDVLRQCHESVLKQDADARHFLVADGFPNPEISRWNASHIVLPISHDDVGNTPRGIGSVLAWSEGYEFVAYLDADNWYHADHLKSLLSLHESTGADICCSFRTFHDLQGRVLTGIEEADEMNLHHVDTSCFLIHKNAFESLNVWLRMPRRLGPIGDRIYKASLNAKNFRFAHSRLKTVAFRSQYESHYITANALPPPNAKRDTARGPFEWLMTIEGARETVKALGFFPL